MSKEAIEKICKDLDLPLGDEFTQDWIYELPEEHRTLDSFKKYFLAYIFHDYELEVKKILFSLMLDITNDMIGVDVEKGNHAWLSISYILAKDESQLKEELEYWANEDEPIEDSFAISSQVRNLLSQND